MGDAMALTLRSNGSGSSNLINASWFNDFYNLLTGAMTDQPVTLANTLSLTPATNNSPTANVVLPSAPTGDIITYGSQVTGDTGNRIGMYIGSTGYGGIKGGAGAGSTAFLFATSTGWQTDQVFKVNNTLNANKLTTTGTLSATNQVIDLQQSFGIFSDNTASTFAGATSRLWINAGGATGTQEIHLGPRIGSTALAGLRIIANNVTIDANGSGSAGVFKVQGGVTTSLDAGAITTNGSGTLSATQLKDGGSRVAVIGSHSAGQTIISYGTGAPASLAANEIYIQIA